MSSSPISLTTDPIPQLIWRIALPSSVGMLFNTLFNFGDTFCAGLLSTDALAALSLSFPLYFLITAIAGGLSQGTTALIANALGGNDDHAARLVFAQSIVVAFFAGLALSVAGLLVAPAVFEILGATGAYLSTVLAFMNVILAGAVFFVLNMALNSGLAAQGETRPYRDFLIAGFIANCALNPLLMWGLVGLPPLGVAGIALATVIVQIVGCIWLWRRVRRTSLFASMPLVLFRPDRKMMKEVALQSGPAALNMVTIAMGIFVITWFVRQFGKEAVAATGIATRIEQVILLPAIGLGSAMISITGQNYGARIPQRVREAWRTNLKFGVLLTLCGSVVLWTFGTPLMRVFTSDATVISAGRDYFKASALTLEAYPILFVTVFMMQGLKRPLYGLWIGLYRQVLAPVPVITLLALSLGWGLWGVWVGFGLVAWSAAIFALWWGSRTIRQICAHQAQGRNLPKEAITALHQA